MRLSGSLLCSITFLLLQQDSLPLHVSNTLKRSTTPDCNMVLTKNLECPSIGSFPVAGTCEYFARCIQTFNGVESEVEFCPRGQVYISNSCQRSDDPNDCPQRTCSLKNGARPPSKTIFPDETTAKSTTTTTSTTQKSSKPKFNIRKPLLETLHPSTSDAAHQCLFPMYLFITYIILYIMI